MMKWLARRGVLPGLAGLCLSALAAMPATARPHHHHANHYLRVTYSRAVRGRPHVWHAVSHARAYPVQPYSVPSYPVPAAGFGPTSAGVSSILIDAQTGAEIFGQGVDVQRYPASLTKLMTLDLAFQALAQGRLSLNTQIPVSFHAQMVEPVKLGLVAGQFISVQDAILAMTTMSANDAATALGEYLGNGSEQRCADMMTLRAHALGMAQTQFANASGLPDPYQMTTARDLSVLARDIVVNYPQFQGFFEVTSFNYQGRQVYSNNQMLRTYAGATGMKTGYTDLARHNLVTSAMRGGHELIGVVLHEPDWGSTYAQMTAMLDAGFAGSTVEPGMAVASAAPAAAYPALAARQFARRLAPPQRLASLPPPPPALVQRVATSAHGAIMGGWVAQLGVYKRMAKARIAAINARALGGMGIARIARVQTHGQIMWTAQLAGLSYHSAHVTCSVMAAHGTSCRVLPPYADHLAMISGDSGT